ncbi:MAG: polyphosphate polymerase domain-containing protein [Clostridia bacterium]
MVFRHEFKHEITEHDFIVLKSKLSCALIPDNNGDNGKYKIRSLYFDNIYDSALREKVDGVNHREKFRIRSYDGDANFIRLEKKSKINGLTNKISARISAEQVQKIIDGDIEFMKDSPEALVRELYLKMHTKALLPKTLVDYTRQAYTHPAGNVRITLDYDIKTGLSCYDFLNNECVTVTAGEKVAILEVKWDEFLPDFVRDLVQIKTLHSSAFSKYAACRVYG